MRLLNFCTLLVLSILSLSTCLFYHFTHSIISMCHLSEQLSDKKKMARKGIHDPGLKTMPKVTGSFVFAPPEKVEVIGSFASGTITTLNPTIDVVLVLPKVC